MSKILRGPLARTLLDLEQGNESQQLLRAAYLEYRQEYGPTYGSTADFVQFVIAQLVRPWRNRGGVHSVIDFHLQRAFDLNRTVYSVASGEPLPDARSGTLRRKRKGKR